MPIEYRLQPDGNYKEKFVFPAPKQPLHPVARRAQEEQALITCRVFEAIIAARRDASPRVTGYETD